MSTAPTAPVGPVDLAIIGFTGELQQGGLRQAVVDAVESGTVRVLDLLIVRKEADGEVFLYDAEDSGENEEVLGFPAEVPDLIGEEDARLIAEQMGLDTTVVVIAWENVWAARIAGSVRELGGELLAMERIPAADVRAVIDAFALEEES